MLSQQLFSLSKLENSRPDKLIEYIFTTYTNIFHGFSKNETEKIKKKVSESDTVPLIQHLGYYKSKIKDSNCVFRMINKVLTVMSNEEVYRNIIRKPYCAVRLNPSCDLGFKLSFDDKIHNYAKFVIDRFQDISFKYEGCSEKISQMNVTLPQKRLLRTRLKNILVDKIIDFENIYRLIYILNKINKPSEKCVFPETFKETITKLIPKLNSAKWDYIRTNPFGKWITFKIIIEDKTELSVSEVPISEFYALFSLGLVELETKFIFADDLIKETLREDEKIKCEQKSNYLLLNEIEHKLGLGNSLTQNMNYLNKEGREIVSKFVFQKRDDDTCIQIPLITKLDKDNFLGTKRGRKKKIEEVTSSKSIIKFNPNISSPLEKKTQDIILPSRSVAEFPNPIINFKVQKQDKDLSKFPLHESPHNLLESTDKKKSSISHQFSIRRDNIIVPTTLAEIKQAILAPIEVIAKERPIDKPEPAPIDIQTIMQMPLQQMPLQQMPQESLTPQVQPLPQAPTSQKAVLQVSNSVHSVKDNQKLIEIKDKPRDNSRRKKETISEIARNKEEDTILLELLRNRHPIFIMPPSEKQQTKELKDIVLLNVSPKPNAHEVFTD